MTLAARHSIGRGVVALAMVAAVVAPAVNAQNGPAAGLKVTRGKELPVCQAYLRRLRQSHFDTSPFCGRPEDESVAGFQHLERRQLTEAEALPLVNRVLKFMSVGNQSEVQRTYYSNTEHPELSHWSEDLELPGAISDYGSRTLVWTYTTPLDVENDGAPQRVILWQGYPAATHGSGRCMQTRAFVLSADGRVIDQAKTRAVFTTPAYVSTLDSPSTKAASERRVIPIGDSLGIMLFEGRYYIDAVDQPDSENAPATYTLFLHHDGQTKKVCLLR